MYQIRHRCMRSHVNLLAPVTLRTNIYVDYVRESRNDALLEIRNDLGNFSARSTSDKIYDILSYLFALVLLEKVTGIVNNNFWLSPRTRDERTEKAISPSG